MSSLTTLKCRKTFDVAKFYFVRFSRKSTPEIFYKPGYTEFYDVMDRMRYILADYPQFEVKVLCSAYHRDLEVVKAAEAEFIKRFPKNFWLPEKISGITECVKLEGDRYYEALRYAYEIRDRFYKDMRKAA